MKDSRILRWLPFAASAALLLVLTLLTPFVMKWWAPGGMPWQELSQVSQTYAAVSIPLSAAALLGVVWSLVMQARQMRASLANEYRASHRDLLMRALDDPELDVCWEPPPAPLSRARRRQYMYANAIIINWRAEYLSGWLSDNDFLINATLVMRGEIMREFWRMNSPWWHDVSTGTGGRRRRRFVALLDEALRRAENAGPPVSPAHYYLPESG